MSLQENDRYRFDEFELDPTTRTFSRGGAQIALYPKAFEILVFLVNNPGRVVTKEELFKAVWPESFVEEGNLARQVSSLRRALGDRAACIVTIPGRGYQFAARVEGMPLANLSTAGMTGEILVQRVRERTQVVIEESFPAPIQSTFDTGKNSLRSPPDTSRRALVIAAAVLAATGILATGIYLWKKAHAAKIPAQAEMSAVEMSAAHRRSIAVLGFRNLSSRSDEMWLSTALAEMLSTELVAGEKLRLVSGEDIARTKLDLPLLDAGSFSRETLSRLHKNLNSDLVVLGSYTVLGKMPDARIRLDLRLQDTAVGETVADVAVMGSEADLFDLVSQAGSQLREKLGVEEVSPVDAVSVRASLPASREAARLYSEGLARLRVYDALGARSLLDQAITADSKFALAHSAMAEAWARLGYDKKARQEARQAYDLSSELSREAKLLVEGRYRDIDHEYEKAVDVYRVLFTLFPDNVDYGLKFAEAQVNDGRAHNALDTVKSLRKLPAPTSEDPRIDMQESAAWTGLSDYKQSGQALARAAEKAATNGSRLMLAQARQSQCWVFGHTGPTESAIATCHEAADIFAAAGDEQGEASSLRSWADAIREADAPAAIRLYLRALGLFRGNGSERGVASAYNNLGVIYESQGDLANAEKMHRQALAGFRLVEDKSSEASALGNIANVRLDQGDLRQALQLYEESLELDREDPGRAANTGYNIASVRELQGDIAGARQGFEQSLAIWQKAGDQHSAPYAMAGLGDLALLEADFPESRKMYEQAIAIRKAAGSRIEISETQLYLATLSLEEALAPGEQEAVLRQVLDVFQKEKESDDEIQAWCVLARALLAQGKTEPAKVAMQRAQSLAVNSQNPAIRWGAAIDGVRIKTGTIGANQTEAARSASGELARKDMAGVIAKSQELGYSLVALDARLAMAEMEMRSGQTAAGRAHLNAIEADARAKGYNLVARKAAIAHG